MLDPKKRAELDQAVTAILEFFPPVWAGLYRKLLEEEMPPFIALEMVKAYIMRPDPPHAEKPEDKDE